MPILELISVAMKITMLIGQLEHLPTLVAERENSMIDSPSRTIVPAGLEGFPRKGCRRARPNVFWRSKEVTSRDHPDRTESRVIRLYLASSFSCLGMAPQ